MRNGGHLLHVNLDLRGKHRGSNEFSSSRRVSSEALTLNRALCALEVVVKVLERVNAFRG